MLVNTDWLLEYITEPCSLRDLLKALESTPLEIEAHHPLSHELRDIVVGFIRKKDPLPGSDGMYICQADIGDGKSLQVVCASEHPIEVGWGVPIARGGTRLPTGIQIKSERYHGVYSEGMICLDAELGMLARGSGLQVFHDESGIGKRLAELIPLTASILDLKAPSNRPDLLCLIGIAREVAAILDLTLKLPAIKLQEEPVPAAKQVSVEIVEPALCARYMCRLIRNVTIGKSPAWLSSRLRSAGSNPINNVVDITNFVMREWGQPLHAFDFNTLLGPKVIVRKMAPNEQLELLDETVVSGEKEPLVIADAERPIALAGIMGGKNTQINPHTTDVLLESAYFNPVQLKKSWAELRLSSTDAFYRFSRGVDPNFMLQMALERAAALIAELASGAVLKDAVDVYPNKTEPRRFHLTAERVSSYLGKQVDAATIKHALQPLGMQCSDELAVVVPTWRVDANDAVVLIEDVARLIGYDQLPLQHPPGPLTAGRRNSLDSFRKQTSTFFADAGFLESRNLSLESPELASQFSPESEEPVKLINSLKEDMSVLRKSLLPGLLNTVERNARRDILDFRYFELDRTFVRADGEVVETWKVAAVLGGAVRDLDWSATKSKFDFFHAKGVAETLLEKMGIAGVDFRPGEVVGFKKGETALVSRGEELLGVLGAIDIPLLVARKIHEPIYGFEFNLHSMCHAATSEKSFKEPPRTPAIVRDLAVEVKRTISYAEIERTISRLAGELLEEIRCTDVYEGKPIKEGNRSISFRLRFRDPQRNLSNEDVTTIIEAIVQELARQYDAKLRM